MNTAQLEGNWTSCPGGWTHHTGQGVAGSVWHMTWGGYGWRVIVIDEITGWRSVAEGETDDADAAQADAAALMATALPHALALMEANPVLADRAARGR